MPQISSGSPSPAPVAAKRRTGRKSGFTVKDSSDEGTASPTSEDLAPSSPAGASGDGTPDDDGKGEIARTTRSGKAFGVWQSRRRKLRQEAIDDPDMEVEDEEEEDEEEESDEAEEDPFEPGACSYPSKAVFADHSDIDLSTATVASLTRLLRDELVQMCEARGIEVGGTKPQLAKSLLAWVRRTTAFPLKVRMLIRVARRANCGRAICDLLTSDRKTLVVIEEQEA